MDQGAAELAGLDGDQSVVFIDDLLHQREPQFGPLVLLPQAVEGQAVAVGQILGAWAVILQQQADAMRLAERREAKRSRPGRQAADQQLEQLPQRQHQAQRLGPHQQL